MSTPPDFQTIKVTCDGRRGTLTLNRPDRLNALSNQLMAEVAEAASWFDHQSDLRVVIVSGAGRAFSAGFDALERTSPVLIAALHGHVVGGGLVVAAACDLRIATADVSFSIPEVDLGIPLAWGGIPRLVREIGPALTKELVMTCRPFGAEEAMAAGFLNRIVAADDLASAADELAEAVASRPRAAVLATKRHVNAVTDQMVGTGRSWSDADGLTVALRDPEGRASRDAYLERMQARKKNRG